MARPPEPAPSAPRAEATPAATAAEKRTALAAAVTGGFLTPFMGSAINIALPALGAELSLDAVSLGWVATSYLVAAAVFLVPFGRAADMVGRRRVYMIGTGVFAVGSTLCALAPSAAWLLAFRVVQGLGGAMTFGTGTAIVSSVFPPRERGRALGIAVAAVYLGLSLGPFAGGFLVQHLGWRSIFLVLLPFALAVLALMARLPRDWREPPGARFDWIGSALYGLAIVALMLGLPQLPAAHAAVLAAAGLAGLGLFAAYEAGAAHPVFDVALFGSNRVFAFSNLAALANYAATFASGFLLSLYLQYLKGLGPAQAGALLVFQPAVMAALSPAAGRLSDRMEPRVVASVGMGLSAAGLAGLAFLSAATPLWALAAALVVLGLGFALFSSPNTNAVMGSVEPRRYGVAAATLGTMRLLGQTLSMALVMVVLSALVGPARIGAEQHPAFLRAARTSFAVFAALCAAGVFASLARGNRRSG